MDYYVAGGLAEGYRVNGGKLKREPKEAVRDESPPALRRSTRLATSGSYESS